MTPQESARSTTMYLDILEKDREMMNLLRNKVIELTIELNKCRELLDKS